MHNHGQYGTDEQEQNNGEESHICVVLYEGEHFRVGIQVGGVCFQIREPHEEERKTENEFTDRLTVAFAGEDEHGKSCDKWESFPTKEEATNRKKQIEHELAAGTFLIPSSVTVAEFLMDWLPKQCSKHKWAPKTYESNLSTIQNLIIPYIGSMEMQKLKPYHMENLYTTLSKTPCGSYIEGKKQELTEKQKQRFLSGTTIHEVHRLLGTAFQYAVEWGILVKSPVPVDSPKKSTQERTIWTVEEMRAALDSMEDPILSRAQSYCAFR